MALMKKMAAVAVTGSLLFGLVGTAFAADASQIGTAANRLQTLGIVNGMDATGDLQLDQTLTRAQLMKIMVWAYGQKDNAAILKGAVAFPDTSTHWASGEIAIAKNIIVEKNGFTMGMPDGNFAPEAKLTAAQAVAFMVKFLGIAPTNDAWPANYINAAVNAGLITTADAATIKDVETTRGFAFFLADQAFAAKGANGQSVYTTYVKPTAPVLTAEAAELNTTATKVTVTGTVSKDATKVFVGTPANTITVGADGSFSFDANLELGANSIVIGATDIVGATTTKTISVSRTVGEAVAITAPASISVTAGQTADFAVAVKDASGSIIKDASFEVTSDLGTYADGKFTAGTTAGAGTATVKAGDLSATVNVTVVAAEASTVVVTPASLSMASGAAQAFTATVTDANGNAIEGASVTWSATGGIIDAQGNFAPTATGVATITATSGALSGTATVTVFGQATALKVSAPSTIVSNGVDATTFTVAVVDASGNVVENSSSKVTVRLSENTYFGLGTDGTVAASADAVNGVATFTLKSKTNSTADRQAVLTASADSLTGANTAVRASKQVLSSIGITADPGVLGADNDSRAVVTLQQYDQQGVKMGSAADTSVAVALTLSDSTYGTLSRTPVTFAADAEEVTFASSVKTGSVTISGAVTTTGKTSIPVTSANIALSAVYYPTQLSVDSVTDAKSYLSSATASAYKQAVTIRVKDMNGNQVSNTTANNNTTLTLRVDSPVATDLQILKADGTTAAVTGANGRSLTTTATINPVGGKYTFYVTSTKATTLSYTVNGVWDSTPDITLASATASGNIVAGNPSAVTLTPSQTDLTGTNLTLPADGVTTGTVSVKVADRNGNPVTGAYSLKVTKVAGSPSATKSFSDLVLTTENGEASFQVTASTNNNGLDFYTVVSNDSAVTLSQALITVNSNIVGVAQKLVLGTMPTFTAGQSANVKVAVTDFTGKTIVTDNSTPVHLVIRSTDANGAIVAEQDAIAVNGIATLPVTLTATKTASGSAASYYFAVTSGDLVGANQGSIGVTAGAAANVALTLHTPTMSIAADGSSTGDLSISLKDAAGNTTTDSDTVTLKLDGSNFVKFANVNNITGYTYVSATEATFTVTNGTTRFDGVLVAQAYIGSSTITATSAAELTGTTGTISTIGTLAPATMTVAAPTTVTAGGTHNVVITLVDANGNRVTNAAAASTSLSFSYVDPTGAASQAVNFTANSLPQGYTFYKGQITIPVTVNKAGTYSYVVTGTYATSDLGRVTTTGAVTPAAASALVIEAQPSDLFANGSDTTTYTVKVKDGQQNVVTGFTGTIEFQILSGNDYAALVNTTSDVVNGVGYVTVRAKTVAGTATLQARVAGEPTPASLHNWVSQTVVVKAGAANTAVVWDDLSATVAASGTDTVTFQVRDANGNAVANAAVTAAISSTADGIFTLTSASGTTNAQGLVTFTVNVDAAAVAGQSATVTASFTNGSGSTVTATSGTITVQ